MSTAHMLLELGYDVAEAESGEEALRMLAPRGRVVVVEGQRRPGLFGLLPSKVPGLPAADVTDALKTAGARAVRTLADIDGVAYYEAK